jgi:hypothetical protein
MECPVGASSPCFLATSGHVHPLHVQLLHRVGVHHDHRQLGQRVDAHAVQGVAGGVEDRLLVDLPAGLVVDVDRHDDVVGYFLLDRAPLLLPPRPLAAPPPSSAATALSYRS